MGRIRQQVGSLNGLKWVQDPVQASSSLIGCSDKAESVFLPVIARRNCRASQETGSGKSSESRNSWFLFPAIPSTEKERKVTTSNRPFLAKSVHKQTSFQDGVKSVRQSIMANNWAVSIDLTDAYPHVLIHPVSRKYLRFVFGHQVLQFTALPFGMLLSPWIFLQLMNVIAAHLRLRAIPVFPYLEDWLIRDLIHNQLLSHKIHSSNGTKSGSHTKSKEVRFDSNTTIHIYRYGISNSAGNSQSTSGSSKSSYSDYQNYSLSKSSFGTNFPFSFGLTHCSSSFNYSRQIAFTTSANVPIIGLETSHSSIRSSSYNQQYDQIPFEVVDEHQSFCSRSTHSPSRPQSIPLYRCQSLRLGSSSGTYESILSWSLVGRPIPTPYQHVGNNGHLFRIDKSLQIYSPFLCHDFYRQHNSGLIYQQARRDTFSQPMCGGMENPPMVPKTSYCSQDSTYPRQIQCFGRQVIENQQNNQNSGHWIGQ